MTARTLMYLLKTSVVTSHEFLTCFPKNICIQQLRVSGAMAKQVMQYILVRQT